MKELFYTLIDENHDDETLRQKQTKRVENE